jgi:DNA ligase-1
MNKLYKRTATNAIQVWWQEIVGGTYRTCSGQVGGVITYSEYTKAAEKNSGRSNATTVEEQARLEVESNYRRKIKDGYVDTPESAGTASRFTPMLAKSYEDYEDQLPSEVWSQPKLDGIRCIANKDGLWSRKGDRIVSCPHIEQALRPLFDEVPGMILDGELYNHELKENFNEITSLVKTTKPTSAHLAKTAAVVQYHIYDAIADAEHDWPQRLLNVSDAVQLVESPAIVAVRTASITLIHGRELLDAMYSSYLEDGYEGQMIRLNNTYEMKRSKYLLKRKEFVDSEFEVVSVHEGVGNASGGAKICVLRHDTDPSRTFSADIMGTREYRADLLKNKEALIGAMATVKYFKQRTPAGIPRFGKVKTFNVGGKW